MALINICLAKSTIMSEQNIAVEYLIHFEGTLDKGYSKSLHEHDCWQMEVMLSGQLEAEIDGKKLEIEAPSIFMIPPGIFHGFKYQEMTKIISIRFNAAPLSKNLLFFPDMEILSDSCGILNMLLNGKTNLTNDRIVLLENIIESFFQIYIVKEIKGREDSNPIIERATRIMEHYPYYNIRVSELASKCVCSQGYLLSLFKKEKGVSLKKYINEERIKLIKKHLIYSDMNIGEIALKTGFPDIYAFSRFFKKMTKFSPSSYRFKIKMG